VCTSGQESGHTPDFAAGLLRKGNRWTFHGWKRMQRRNDCTRRLSRVALGRTRADLVAGQSDATSAG